MLYLKNNFRFVFVFLFISQIVGCATLSTENSNEDSDINKLIKQQVYQASYESVWKAAHKSIAYTIASENSDFGFIETDYVKAVDGWLPPFQTRPQYPSSRYKLVFTFAKGKTNAGQESVRLTIDKKIEVFRDFISEVKIVESDGLEEKALLYRIERELIIDKALKRALEDNTSSPN